VLEEAWAVDGLKGATVQTYRKLMVRLFAATQEEGVQPEDLNHRHCLDYLKKRADWKPAYQGLHRVCFNKALDALHQAKITKERGERLRMKGQRSAPIPLAASQREREKLLAEAEKAWQSERRLEKRAGAIVLLLMFTGLRASEIGSIRNDRLRVEHGVVTGWVVQRKHGLESGQQLVGRVSEIVTQWWMREGAKTEGYLFEARAGCKMNYNTIYKAFRKIGDQAGVTLHPHQLRTILGEYLANAKATARDIMDVMGHTNPNSVLRYLPRSADRQQNLMSGFIASWSG
jgi:integrase